jgi:TonB-linked SusC/RagA family outer membrane protein
MRKPVLMLVGLLLLCAQVLLAQNVEVSGTVKDDKGNGIAGATVQDRKTRKGTATDEKGNFTLSAPRGSVIEVSFVGFDARTFVAGAQSGAINVVLPLSNTSGLNEVVVTGMGVATSKKNIAIAVESITAEKLPQVPTADIGNALVGKIAGAQISSVGGSPGQPVQILLRGINSIRGGTAPMILLDGVQVVSTGLESLDLNSIERVEVVQGPAASTIYGAQGANGVIQLFSKKGKQGKLNIDLSSSIGVNELLNVGNVNKARKHPWQTNANGEVIGAGSGQPMVFDKETGSYLDNPIGSLISPTSAFNKSYDKNLKWYDHYKMFFGRGTNINNVITITGAKDRFDFSLVGSNNRQTTVFKNNGEFNRSNITTNVGVELFKNLRLRSTTQLVFTRNTQLDPDGRNMFYAINNARPFANFEEKDEQGLFSPYFGDAVGVNHYNFFYIQENANYKERNTDIVQSLNLNYKFNRFVELDAKYGYNRSLLNRRFQLADQSASVGAEFWQYWAEFYSPRTSFASPTTGTESGEINQREFLDVFQNFLTTATARFDLEKDFKVNFPLTSTTQVAWDYRNRETSDYWSWGSDAPAFTPYNASNMANFKIATDEISKFVTYGYFVNQRFDYAGIAGVSGGFRSDYSSAFGKGSKPFTFPRGDAYVRLSGMNFWKNSKVANTVAEWKLRAAYGEAGIQPGAYDRFPILNTSTIGNQSALATPVTNANPALQVEVAKELEIGTDISLNLGKSAWFRSALVSFTWWDRTSSNVIDQVDVAPSVGIGRQLTNAMTLASNGIQASLNLNVLSSRNLSWNFTTNFSKQKSVIESVEGGAEILKTSAAGSAQYVLRAGEQVGQLYGYNLLRSVTQRDAKGSFYIPEAEQANYEVASNGWVVNKTTKQPFASPERNALGDPNPNFNMAFINEFNYKGFLTFYFQWDWLSGNNVYNQTKGWMYRDGIHKDYDQPITINGQTDAWSAFYRGVYAARAANGTKNYFMEDASFWRLRNLALGFDLAKMIKIKGVSRMQLLLTGRNLLTFTNYTGMDPEVSSGTINSGWDRGVDHNTIPNVKTWQVGLNLGF